MYVDDNFTLKVVTNIALHLHHLFFFIINKIHSYFLYSSTDVRIEATNRINKREKEA